MYILLDIGGTKTRIARSRDLESFDEATIFDTPQNFEEGIALIRDEARRIAGGDEIIAAAVGMAASPDRDKKMVVGGGPNTKDWLGKPLVHQLEEALEAKVYLENDTAMGGLAQITYGPAKGKEIAVYMTVSTGVGGCRFVNGEVDKSAMGFEPGWQIISSPAVGENADEWFLGHCSKGYLESVIGGACVEKQEGKKPYEITDEAFWDGKARFLAYGLHNICLMWSPDIIVIGGSMMNKIGIPIDKTKEYLAQTLKDVFPNSMPGIVHADFGDEMGLYGAMAYLKKYHGQ